MRRRRRVAGATVGLLVIVGVSACSDGASVSGSDAAADRQARVAERGATVMPFDQDRTTHIFRATETGGVQRVVADDADASRQVRLIRAHLREEADRFSAGDFTDPMAIHGAQMPGIRALRSGADRIGVEYSSIPRGAQLTYATTDPDLVAALHDWFDAQLMDHGSHAHD